MQIAVSQILFDAYCVCMKTLSVTLICKNEQDNLKRLLPTLDFADEIIVVDTGSDDGTVETAQDYGCIVGYFKWRDDFAAARNYAINLASGDYVMWLDADDAVSKSLAREIERWKQDGSDTADTYYIKYRMGTNSDFWFWRERILKRCSKCRFKGFIHEAIVPFGQSKYLNAEIIHTSSVSHEKRNLEIYRKAAESGRRFFLRDKYYFARTLTENGLFAEAEHLLNDFRINPRAYAPDRADACKLLARQYLSDSKSKQALNVLIYGTKILPPDSETCCLIGDCYFADGKYLYAAQWYEYANISKIQYGFVNDYYKSFYPDIQLSVCYYRLGNYGKAQFYHRVAKAINPKHPSVIANDKFFQNKKK